MVTSAPTLGCMSRAALRAMLAAERDAHRRQRELVRASLVARPGASRPSRAD
jgi:hypothetical protein